MIIKYKSLRRAFTMLELVFVIVIMGIIGKFGVEFVAQAYKSFIHSNINNTLQTSSESAVEFIASRLQYRIRASTIARESNNTYTLLSDYYNETAPILEWIGADAAGFRGNTKPYWSGIIDLNSSLSNSVQLISPETNTTDEDNLIMALSNNLTGINDAAIYFIDPDALPDANKWGWNANVADFNAQSDVYIHPITRSIVATNSTTFEPINGLGIANTFSGVTAFEYYQLAWTAYAVGIDDWNATTKVGTLKLWYNYQPWQGERYTNGTSSIIMENVSSFRFISAESVVKIQVCVKSSLVQNEEYSICKEKTVF